MSLAPWVKLKALPVQFLQSPAGVILKRGCTELRISGEGATDAVQRVLRMTIERQATLEQICEQFALPNREQVGSLIHELVKKRILVSVDDHIGGEGPETNLEIFYWHFGEPAFKVAERINACKFFILGVNFVSRQLATSLFSSGVTAVQIVDQPLLRNIRLFDEAGQLDVSQWTIPKPLDFRAWLTDFDNKSPSCIVATSDFGAHDIFREWNRFCVEQNCHFFPVILQNLAGYIGPLVIPRETSCFECLRARQNSHLTDTSGQQVIEENAFEGQLFIGFHPSMASVVGDIAGFELTRFYGGVLPAQKVGTLIEVSLVTRYMATHNVLRVPRCPTCSALNKQAPVEMAKRSFVAGDKSGK